MDEVVKCGKGNYYIESEVNISDTDFFIARDKKSKKQYLVGEKQAKNQMIKYRGLMVTDDYASALNEWIRRLSNAAADLKPCQSVVRT